VTPVHGELVTIRAFALGDIPKGVEGDADGEEGDDDPDVGDGDDGEQDLGGEGDVVVAESAEVETEDRDLDRGEADGVTDVEAPCYLREVS